MVKPFLLAPRVDGTIIKERKKGVLVFRQDGKAGADHPCPCTITVCTIAGMEAVRPVCTIAWMEAARLEQQFITEWAKINRTTRLLFSNAERKGVKARQAKAAARIKIPKPLTKRETMANENRAKVIELHTQGKKPYHIAQQTGLTVRRVNQIKKTGK